MNDTLLSATDLASLVDFAVALAHEASAVAVSEFGASSARRKFDGTLVTQTDERIDRLVGERLGASFPDHAVLSEERDTWFEPGAPYSWVVDPLDGTTNFARGMPIWGISIALLAHGTPVLGVLEFPLLQEVFTAQRGAGAARNGLPIRTADVQEADDDQLLMKCTRTDERYQLHTPLKSRMLGSAAYSLCKVGDGTAVGCIEARPKVWDLAAAWLVVVEAGGVMTALDGRPIFPLPLQRIDYRSLPIPVLAAANPDLQAHLRSNLVPRA